MTRRRTRRILVREVVEHLGVDARTLDRLRGEGLFEQETLDAGEAHAGHLYLLLGSFSGTSPGLPVDGHVLPMTPMTAFSRGAQAPVPFVIGYNADEGSLLADFMHPAGGEFEPGDDIDIRPAFIRSYGSPEQTDRILAAYPGLADGERDAVHDHVADHMFGVHVDHASRQHAAAGHPVYRYHYRSVPASPTQTAGAFHAAEVLNVFGTSFPLVPPPEGTDELDADMGDRWVEFGRTGSPNVPGRVEWPRYDPAAPLHMVFDRPTSAPQDCPAQVGLDIMRERIDHLSASVAD